MRKETVLQKSREVLKNARGITLLELLFAFAILGIVVVTSAGLLIRTSQASEENKSRLLALNTAQSVLDVVKETVLVNVPNIDATGMIPADLVNGAVNIQTNPQDLQNAQVATVTVTVNWTGPANRPLQLQVSTMRSRF